MEANNYISLPPSLPPFLPPSLHQITREDVSGYSIDRLSFPGCQLHIKWVGEEGSDLLPSDLHYNVSFIGSHQKRPENFFHLHVRSVAGRAIIILF